MSRAKLAIAIISIVIAGTSVLLAVRLLSGPSRTLFDGIAIEGDAGFIERTRAALEILKTNHRDGYLVLTKQVLSIKQAERSGADVWNRSIQVADPTSTYSTTWYASSLVHDCRHISLYNDYLAAYPGQTVPNEVYSGQDAELACMRLQIDALGRIGAPEKEIEWAKKQDGTFPDVNKDGTYDEKDYKKRNW